MPVTFFAQPPTQSKKFTRDIEAAFVTSAVYYPFKNYAVPDASEVSELVICRNEEDQATTIITPRLVLRSFNQIAKADLITGLKAILMDPVNIQYYGEGIVWSEEKIADYIQQHSVPWTRGKKLGVYAIYDVLNPEQMIGMLSFYDDVSFAHYEQTIGLGYILLHSTHGKKIGRELGEIGWQAFVHEMTMAIQSGERLPTGLAATAHPQNHASVSILTHVLGDAVPGIEISYGPNQPRALFFRPYDPQLTQNQCLRFSC